MPRQFTQRERLADLFFYHLQFFSRYVFVLAALIGYYLDGWQGVLVGALLGLVFGWWMRRSMGLRPPAGPEGFFVRKRERANGSRRGVLEWSIEKLRVNELTPERCAEMCKVYDEAQAQLSSARTREERFRILKILDRRIKAISYGNTTNDDHSD
jgi:hypothetical protein